MTTPLTLDTVGRDDGSRAVVATGEIDLSNVASFTTALEAAVEGSDAEAPRVEVDLTGVDYLDSGGINVLFTHADRIRVVANPILVPVLTISGFTELAPVEPARV
ncbi:STAS domain-containing protein [Mycolicibacterium sediminis]|uniref:Anti-anti-sigma factor n=1 Tax=Mycolicibacterium sediminis TaxID=1286180 RepID=A0A7I7QVF5_9MYCO|nr:STAS domain-containing protein [Mycolicibacterium sediminis]BBY30245.1 anti-anti-sigma factor [Mycolicibacterium sediminis]